MAAERVVWVNGRFLSRNVTGVERVAHELLGAMAQHLLRPDGSTRSSVSPIRFKWVLDRASEVTLPDYGKNWEVARMGRYEGHAWEQLDLAWFQPKDWVLSLCNTGPMLRRNHVLFFHDAQVYAIPGNFDWKFRWWYRALLNIAGRCSHTLLTNSEFSKAELARYTGVAVDKFQVIHLAADHMNRLRPALPAALATALAGRPFVLSVSSASPNKNFAGVQAALASMGEAAPLCVIVGQTYSKVFKAQSLNQERVVLAGYVSDEELAALYQQADCLVYPSFYEGFGLPPLEAMQMGCQVVVSGTSSLPEVCGNAATYCDPADVQSIAKGIASLLAEQTDPVKATTSQQRMRANVDRFTWQKSATSTLAALQNALYSTRNPNP